MKTSENLLGFLEITKWICILEAHTDSLSLSFHYYISSFYAQNSDSSISGTSGI